jgi:hypothetical protein
MPFGRWITARTSVPAQRLVAPVDGDDCCGMMHDLKRFLSKSFRGLVSPLTVSMWLIAAFFATVIGPFGTYDARPFLPHLFQWLVLIGAPTILIFSVSGLVAGLIGSRETLGFHVSFLVCASVSAGALLEFLLSVWLGADEQLRPNLVELWLIVFFILLVMLMFRVQLPRLLEGVPEGGQERVLEPPSAERVQGAEAKTENADLRGANEIRGRLARELQVTCSDRIERISAQGHFVNVFLNESGVQKIRMRFLDALLDIDACAGVVTHRSHWVRRDAMQALRPGVKPVVVLSDGSEVPVSKSHLQTVARLELPELG